MKEKIKVEAGQLELVDATKSWRPNEADSSHQLNVTLYDSS